MGECFALGIPSNRRLLPHRLRHPGRIRRGKQDAITVDNWATETDIINHRRFLGANPVRAAESHKHRQQSDDTQREGSGPLHARPATGNAGSLGKHQANAAANLRVPRHRDAGKRTRLGSDGQQMPGVLRCGNPGGDHRFVRGPFLSDDESRLDPPGQRVEPKQGTRDEPQPAKREIASPEMMKLMPEHRKELFLFPLRGLLRQDDFRAEHRSNPRRSHITGESDRNPIRFLSGNLTPEIHDLLRRDGAIQSP